MRGVAALLALALVGATSTACTSEPVDAEEYVDHDEYVLLYREAVADFPERLPEGVTFPADPPPFEDGLIGAGNGAGMAYFHWNCAWMDVYLSASPGDPLRAEALAELRRWPGTEWAVEFYDDPGGVWDATLDKAELGDLTTLRGFYEADCAYYRSVEAR